jgi:hypothetical protein
MIRSSTTAWFDSPEMRLGRDAAAPSRSMQTLDEVEMSPAGGYRSSSGLHRDRPPLPRHANFSLVIASV